MKLLLLLVLSALCLAAPQIPVWSDRSCIMPNGFCNDVESTCHLGGSCKRCTGTSSYGYCKEDVGANCLVPKVVQCGNEEVCGCDANGECDGAWFTHGVCQLQSYKCQ